MSRYIDAEWLKELYKPYESYNGKELAVPIGAILANIDDAPSIDIPHSDDWEKYSERLWERAYERGKADRPQGEWIDAEIPLESGGSMPIQACNLCKTFYPLAYTGGGHRFCPNCGARMKGTGDEAN